MVTRMLRLPQLRERLPFSRTRLYDLMKQGKFPTPVRLGDRAVFWIEDEVEEWLRKHIEEQRPTQPAPDACTGELGTSSSKS